MTFFLILFSTNVFGQNIMVELKKINLDKIESNAITQTRDQMKELKNAKLSAKVYFSVETRDDFYSKTEYTEDDLLANLMLSHDHQPTCYVYSDSLEFMSRVGNKRVSEIVNQKLEKAIFPLDMVENINPDYILKLLFTSSTLSDITYLCLKGEAVTVLTRNALGDFQSFPLSDINDWRLFNPEMRITKHTDK